MNFKSVLCPVDFSNSSDAALQYASIFAREANALLTLVHVEETLPEYPADIAGYGMGVVAIERNRSANLLANASPAIEGVHFERRVLKGDPAHEILRFAEQENVDLIVMGTHGRRGLSRLVMGSVAESVLRRAKCPVLTVRQPVVTLSEASVAQASATST